MNLKPNVVITALLANTMPLALTTYTGSSTQTAATCKAHLAACRGALIELVQPGTFAEADKQLCKFE